MMSVLLLLFLATSTWAQFPGSRLVDNFEWASAVEPSQHAAALEARGWESRAGGNPAISLTNDAREGSFALKMTQSRKAEDFIQLNYERILPAGFENWSGYRYLAFWVKASVPLSAQTRAVRLFTRDLEQDWARLDPVSVGTEWTYIVYELPPDNFLDELRFFRLFADSRDASIQVPLEIIVDDFQLFTVDPRGPSEVLENFEWGQNVFSNFIDALVRRGWKPRVRSQNDDGIWVNINPAMAFETPGHNSEFALRMAPNRGNQQDYIIQEYEFRDQTGIMQYRDWRSYRYLSFYVRGDSAWRSPFKVQMRDNLFDWHQWNTNLILDPATGRDLGRVSAEWQLVVLDLNETSTGERAPAERQFVRYIRFDIYNNGTRPQNYSIYLDNIRVSSWDPSRPQQPVLTSSEGERGIAADGFILQPAFPNPVRESATLHLLLDAPAAVTAEVFDLLGRRVSTLTAGHVLSAGAHELRWNASREGASSGMYLVRATVNGRTQQQTLVLAR